MKHKATGIKAIPYQGGCSTAVEPALLDGKHSMVQNYRQRHPGFVQRAGQIKQHTTADGTNRVMSIYQFSKGKITERHTYAQMSDSDVLEATNAPPAVTTGVFGAEVFSGSASPRPASWANVNDLLLFANGVDLAQIYPGTTSPVERFIVYKGTSAIPVVPEIGEDYTTEVTDGDTATYAPLDSLGDLAVDFDCIFVKTAVPLNSLAFTVKSANGSAAVAAAKFFNGTEFTAVAGFADGTAVAGATFAQSGAMTWTLPTTHVPNYMFGECGFWTQIYLSSGDLDSETEVSAVTYTAPWQSIQNVWDGVMIPIVEAQLYDASNLTYATFSSSIDLGGADSNGDLLHLACAENACAFYVDVGDTPVKCQSIATVKYWNGTAWAAGSSVSDGTSGLSKSGWITFARPTDEQKLRFNGSIEAYWYQITIPQQTAVVCLNFDGDDAATTFTDLSGKTWTAVGTAQLDTARKKYGTASLLLDGNSDYITTPAHTDFDFGTDDFTIEAFHQVDDLTGAKYIDVLNCYQSATNLFTIQITIANSTGIATAAVLSTINGVTVINASFSIGTFTADTFYHWAIVRKNGVFQGWLDGVVKGGDSTYPSGAVFFDNATPYWVGHQGAVYQSGWMDDLRISKTAVYPLGVAFTPPASALGLAVAGTIPANTTIGIDYQPYYDITEFGKFQTVCAWKNRALYSTATDHIMYLSADRQPQVLNGDDCGILAPGDGRFNRPLAQRRIGESVLVWQEEKGPEGGCLTKYMWVSTVDNIEKKVVSNVLGVMNANCVDVVDGIEFSELNRDIPVMNLAFCLSKYGVYATDSNVCYMIHKDIANYFDPRRSECIRVGYEALHWLKYDSSDGCIHMGLVSGSSATVPNIFPVYDPRDKSWSFDVREQELSCMAEVEAGSGNVPMIQLGGGVDDGTVYILNSGTNDITTAIDAFIMHELDGKGEILNLKELLLRVKAQSAGNITVTPYLNSIAQTAMTLAQTVEIATQTIRRHRVNVNLTGQHISLKVQHNTVSESSHLLDLGTAIDILEEQ